MRKKSKKAIHLSIIQPMLASVLMATSIPLVTFAATRSDADLGAGTPTYQNYKPRTDQTHLFDFVEFRKAHRMRYDNTGSSAPASSASSSSSARPAVPPCATPDASATDEGSDTGMSSSSASLRYEDLSTTEKTELRKQIRIGGCPYDVLPGYRELCESMLKQNQAAHPAALLKPLRNPNQEMFNDNLYNQ